MTSWKKYIFGCAVGNILEWYDFILYGFFASTLAKLFFPTQDHFIALLLTFTIFASGCLIRPLSGVVFGYIGDKFGRKKALVYSIGLITIATTLMGALPTYATVGVAAPLLLVICRLLQGVAVSGEEIGAAIMLAENASPKQQNFVGSIILSSVYLGLFLGAATALVMHLFTSPEFMLTWGWRIPFLSTSVLGFLALKIRLSAFDSREFSNLVEQNQVIKNPTARVFKMHSGALLRTVGISSILAVAIYLFAVYLPSYYTNVAGFSSTQSLSISCVFLFIVSMLVLVLGYLADKRLGSDTTFSIGAVGLIFTSYPIFWLLAQGNIVLAIIAQGVLMIFLAFIAASVLAIVLNMFTTQVRYSGSCIGFNLSMTLFGSTAPIIALTLQKFFNNPIAPCLYLSAAGILSLIALKAPSGFVSRFLGAFYRKSRVGEA
jgi:MFS transporter, MHS family, proline/betaine transporter